MIPKKRNAYNFPGFVLGPQMQQTKVLEKEKQEDLLPKINGVLNDMKIQLEQLCSEKDNQEIKMDYQQAKQPANFDQNP